MNVQHIARLALVTSLLFLPAAAWAQTAVSGAIAGAVRDTSGGVLPGVTVEAASPALIEKVRTVVTDTQGLYRIVDLRPGTYSVTFTLPGFRTLRREGIELTTGFTATVNAELQVGAVEETITVTGEAPIVDTSNVRTQRVFARDTLDALPVSRTSMGYVVLMPGASTPAIRQDVGGSLGDTQASIEIHGNRGNDMIVNIDGMRMSLAFGVGSGFRSFGFNQASVQEITFQTSGISAESETGGVQMNVVPRDGGNIFSGYGAANYANSAMQNNNIGEALVSRGLRADSTLKVKRVYDANGAVGGPIKRDALWFYTAQRWWGTERPLPVPGNYFSQNHGTDRFFVYEPDLSRPHFSSLPRRSHNLRLTWQATEKNKVNFSYERQVGCNCPQIYEGLIAPESMSFHRYPQHLWQASWSHPATNRLLFDAGVTHYRWNFAAEEQIGVSPTDIAVRELSNGLTLNARAFSNTVFPGRSYGTIEDRQYNGRASMSYVTGSHNFKTGLFWMWLQTDHATHTNGDVLYSFLNGVPVSIEQFATPAVNGARGVLTGLYAQDQWTIRKLTFNLGLRFDYLNAWSPEMSAPAGRWLPARSYDRVDNLPNFKDLSPRLGAAYDLFGDGRTALKASLGRYVAAIQTQLAVDNSASATEVINTTRTWTDVNGDLVPQENELGPSSNLSFGTRRVRTRLDDDVRMGFGNREYNWQASAVVEHQLRPGLGVNVGYFRTWYGNLVLTDNVAVTPADFNEFCITAPVDSRLPGGGGNQICGLYDVSPAKFGQVDNLLVQANRSEVYNGVDASMTARWANGAQLSGGFGTGRTVRDDCGAVVDSPENFRFCKVTVPFAAQTQFKLNGVYPLPWDAAISATFQDLPGIDISADHVVTSAQIAPSLGRNLAAGARGTRVVQLIEPNTIREDRRRQVDLRLSRTFRAGSTRVVGTFEVFNALNASSVLRLTTRYGAAWLRPSEVLIGRLFKVGTQITF